MIEDSNLISIILGFVALLLPLLILAQYSNINHFRYAIITVLSFLCCASSICTQLFYTSYLVGIKDWAALSDTSYYTALISAWLVSITFVVNIVVLIVYFGKNKRVDESSYN
jgi:cytochrome c oxidase subunit 4